MTKNFSNKSHRGGSTKTVEHKKSHQNSQNANTNHQLQNETAVTTAVVVQKASIDLKMLTPEQRRLANLMNDKVDVSEIEKKINKIIELTGASKDKAIVALHDCANELDKAIDMILEGDSINESEWKSQARKKKPKAGTAIITPTGKDTVHLNGDAKKGSAGKGRQIRGKPQQQVQQTDKQSQQEKQPTNRSDRSSGFKRSDWKSNREPNDESTTNATANNKELELDDKLDEWQDETATTTIPTANREQHQRTRSSNNENQPFKSSNRYQNNRESQQDRESSGGGARRMNTGPRGNYSSNYNRGNQFGPGGDRNQRTGERSNDRLERRPYQNKGYNSRDKKPGYTSSIDTWSNLTAADNGSSNNNDYAQMTVGNWSDIVSANTPAVQNNQTSKTNELNNDEEWTEPSDNLTIEQAANKVFSNKENASTVSKSDDHQLSKMPNLASIVSGVKPVQQPTQQVHKSSNQSPQQPQQNTSKQTQQQILSTSNNQSILNKPLPQRQQPQQQQQPPQQQQQQTQKAPLDITALLKSQQQQPQQSTNLIRSNIQQQQQQQQQQQRNQPDSNNAYGAALLQSLQQRMVNREPENNTMGKTSSANLNDYVNPYNQNKNLVHANIPNQYNAQQNAPPNLFDNQSHHLHHQNVADQKSLIEKKRRQTKIPETAVEMPNRMPTSERISSLNVQFGALDFSNSDAYGLNDDQITNKPNQFNLSRDSNNEKQNSTSLLNTVRAGQQSNESNKGQQTKESLQNIDHHHSSHHQHIQDNILHQQDSRNKGHQSAASGYQLNTAGYKSDTSNQHSSIYPPNLQNYQSNYGAVNNYGSHQNHNNSSHNNNSASGGNTTNANSNQQQKINLKDLSENSSLTNNQNNNSATANNTTSSGSALGNLVNNTTVTTNVLKNSLTATGKSGGMNSMQQLNVPAPSGVPAPPLLGTPQYIMNMSQPGLSTAFYAPVYDMPMAAADHSFRYNQNPSQEVKYNRTDAQDGQSNHGNPVQSTQAPVTQTPNHQIFSQFPPYFFYTGVNMMTQGLYQTPFLPVQPNPASGNVNQPPHGAPNSNQPHSTAFGNKNAQNQAAYSASAYASSTGYDPITAHQLTQDFSKQNYSSGPPNSNQQTGKQMSSGATNDLVNNNMYTKSHAQLTKNFDKPNAFQNSTPPPFGIATLGYNPNQFIPMIQPQSNPSMLHHTLQNDANQNNNVNQQRGSQAQKNSASNSNQHKNYYNWS